MIKLNAKFPKATVFDFKSITVEAGQTFEILSEGLDGCKVFTENDILADFTEDGSNFKVTVKAAGEVNVLWVKDGAIKHYVLITILPATSEAASLSGKAEVFTKP